MGDTNVVKRIAATLAAAGTKAAFVYPGDPVIELLEALRAEGSDVVLTTREATAGAMAEATAMLTGAVGFCVSTLGPGSTALVPAVACAQLDRVPLLAVSGQIERTREPFFTHQVVDHGRLFGPVTKWAGRIEPASLDTVLAKALRTAAAERPGAVHLTLNADTAEATARDGAPRVPPLGPPRSVPAGFTLAGESEAQLSGLLRGARRPVVLAGAAVVRAGATAHLARLAEALGAPVVVAPMAKGVLDEEHELFAGVADMACNKTVWEFTAGADLLVLAGFDGVELIKPWQLGAPVVHVDTTPNTDQIWDAAFELVGDLAAALDFLAGLAPAASGWPPGAVAAHRARLEEAYEDGRVAGRLNPTDVIALAREAAGDTAVVTTDVGSHKFLVGQGWRTRAPRRVLMTNGLSAMGFGLPAAIAAAIAGEERVYALVGDGGFAMTQPELALAAERRLEMVVLVFSDGSLNRIELKQQLRALPPTATRLSGFDVARVAEALGCEGHKAADAATLEKLLGRGPDGVPLVVECTIDPSQYARQF